MLSVPQSATSAPQETEPIRMKERAEVLGALLSAVSGIETFDLDNADLGLAGTDRDQYEIPVAISVLRALPRLVRPRGVNIVTGASLPSLDDVDHLENLLAVADKYDMLMVVSLVRLALSSRHPNVSPIRLYGIASRMDWEKEAEGASSRTLTTIPCRTGDGRSSSQDWRR